MNETVTTYPAHSESGSQLCRSPTPTPPLWVLSDSIIRLLVRLALLEPKISPFNNTPTWRVVTNWPAYQLVTTRLVGVLLKGEVLGSSNAKRTNNLITESERTHKGGVGSCHAWLWAGFRMSGMGCHKKSTFLIGDNSSCGSVVKRVRSWVRVTPSTPTT